MAKRRKVKKARRVTGSDKFHRCISRSMLKIDTRGKSRKAGNRAFKYSVEHCS